MAAAAAKPIVAVKLLAFNAFLKIVWPSTGLHHDDILLLNTHIYVRRHDDVLDKTHQQHQRTEQ